MNIKEICEKYQHSVDEIAIYKISQEESIISGDRNNISQWKFIDYKIRLLKNSREVVISTDNCDLDKYINSIDTIKSSDWNIKYLHYNTPKPSEKTKKSHSDLQEISIESMKTIYDEVIEHSNGYIMESLKVSTIKKSIEYYNNYGTEITYNSGKSNIIAKLALYNNIERCLVNYSTCINTSWTKPYSSENFVNYMKKSLANQINSMPIANGNYNCIIDKTIISSLLSDIVDVLSGNSLVEKESFLWNKYGQIVFKNQNFSIIENNMGPSIYIFDDFGNTRQNITLINQGIVENFILSYKNYEKLQKKYAYNYSNVFFEEYVGNIHLIPNETHKYSDILEKSKDHEIVIIQDIMSTNFDDRNGNFSLSCRGIKVFNGETQGFYDGIFKGNIITLLDNCIFLDDIYENFSCDNFFAPSIYIENIFIKSE